MTPTASNQILAEGKTKVLRPGEQPEEVRVTFKDAATAFNGEKFQEIPGKGTLNARISAILFELLNQQGIPTCFVGKGASENELIYRNLAMIPLEVVIRNFAYGSVVKRFKFEEGMAFKKPLIEFFYKSDDAGDPQLTDEMIDELSILPAEANLDAIKLLAFQVNEVFLNYFKAINVRCADFKLEVGLDKSGNLMLGDELSPDNFRFRDADTGQVMDKDAFRFDLADLTESYQELLRRLEGHPGVPDTSGLSNAYMASIRVQSRKNILNPESKTILNALHTMGYASVQELRAGKEFSLKLTASSLIEAEKQIKTIGEDILSNPVIEDYSYILRLA
ncbi:MAG: phosphoribosylaminoimidazolesuccinocarboxamide synthase [Vampirovibrio sp.]|nr:phosphoribosylaminoimidazolesuccinocarboxamide synthase [Vampirovibrio sp.]